MPDGVKVVTLKTNSQSDLKGIILDEVGRNLFSVNSTDDDEANANEKKIGETITLTVPKPTQYLLKTKEVTKVDERRLNLVGGENIRLVNTLDGLELDRQESRKIIAEFMRPKLGGQVRLGNSNFEVGILPSNRSRVVRFGFYNTREISEFPGRVWAMVTDGQGRQFQLAASRMRYASIPIVEFELPADLNEAVVDLALFVKTANFGGAEQPPLTEPLVFENDGEHLGLKFRVEQVPNSESKFEVEFFSESGISRPFLLECPNSVPFGGRKTNFERVITFADQRRVSDKFTFDIPAGKNATFSLTVQDRTSVEEIVAELPKSTGSAAVLDPVFGDEVMCIRFNGIRLRN